MFDRFRNRRSMLAAAAMLLLGACSVIPKSPGPVDQVPPPERPAEQPGQLPTDTERHRVALLVPVTGRNAQAGQSIANAANMALLDTNATNLRITTYDTAAGAGEAARRAIAEGNLLILGPLLSDDIPAVATAAKAAKVPVISYSNDEKAAARSVFIMGSVPGQSVNRVLNYANGKGIRTYAALVPRGEYGERASDAMMDTVRANDGQVVAMESYERSGESIASAAQAEKARGGFEAVLIADSGTLSARAAGLVKRPGAASPQVLGSELWSGEKDVLSAPALDGAWFAAVSDTRFGQFARSYRNRFGSQPYRIATLGYDSVLLTLRIAQDWKPGSAFPSAMLLDPDGFLGLDGPFRFNRSGVVERAMEVREIRNGSTVVVSPAPTKF